MFSLHPSLSVGGHTQNQLMLWFKVNKNYTVLISVKHFYLIMFNIVTFFVIRPWKLPILYPTVDMLFRRRQNRFSLTCWSTYVCQKILILLSPYSSCGRIGYMLTLKIIVIKQSRFIHLSVIPFCLLCHLCLIRLRKVCSDLNSCPFLYPAVDVLEQNQTL